MHFPLIVGYAAVFNSPIVDPDGTTILRPGCFAESLPKFSLIATINHLPSLAISSRASAVQAIEDHIGLRVRIDLEDSPHTRLLIDAIRLGHFRGMSFTYGAWSDSIRTYVSPKGTVYREVVECDVWECCVTWKGRNPLAACRLVGEPSWPVDPKAFKKLSALCREAQNNHGYGVPRPIELEKEYDELLV